MLLLFHVKPCVNDAEIASEQIRYLGGVADLDAISGIVLGVRCPALTSQGWVKREAGEVEHHSGTAPATVSQ